MNAVDVTQPRGAETRRAPRRLLARYALLTAALFLPLLWSFVALRNMYPLAAWTVMIRNREGPLRQKSYYFLRGETRSGETVDIPPVTLTGRLGVQSWGLVSATVENRNFKIRFPHPANTAFAEASGGVDKLPRAARVPQLLRAWGELYNARLPQDSARRLRAIRLDAYALNPEKPSADGSLTESWREEL